MIKHMRLVDAHVHLDFYDNIKDILDMTIGLGIKAIFVTHLPELFENYSAQIRQYSNIDLALGFHPILTRDYALNKELFLRLKTQCRVVGEVGLDYSITSSQSLRARQRDAFEFICKNVDDHVLSIHSRLADEDVLRILIDSGVRKAIFHWYSGSERLIEEIIAQGYYFSVNHMMLRSNKGIRILKRIPPDRLLIETDGPFTKYDGRVVTPFNLQTIYRVFAEFYQTDDISNLVWQNYNSLLTQQVKAKTSL